MGLVGQIQSALAAPPQPCSQTSGCAAVDQLLLDLRGADADPPGPCAVGAPSRGSCDAISGIIREIQGDLAAPPEPCRQTTACLLLGQVLAALHEAIADPPSPCAAPEGRAEFCAALSNALADAQATIAEPPDACLTTSLCVPLWQAVHDFTSSLEDPSSPCEADPASDCATLATLIDQAQHLITDPPSPCAETAPCAFLWDQMRQIEATIGGLPGPCEATPNSDCTTVDRLITALRELILDPPPPCEQTVGCQPAWELVAQLEAAINQPPGACAAPARGGSTADPCPVVRSALDQAIRLATSRPQSCLPSTSCETLWQAVSNVQEALTDPPGPCSSSDHSVTDACATANEGLDRVVALVANAPALCQDTSVCAQLWTAVDGLQHALDDPPGVCPEADRATNPSVSACERIREALATVIELVEHPPDGCSDEVCIDLWGALDSLRATLDDPPGACDDPGATLCTALTDVTGDVARLLDEPGPCRYANCSALRELLDDAYTTLARPPLPCELVGGRRPCATVEAVEDEALRLVTDPAQPCRADPTPCAQATEAIDAVQAELARALDPCGSTDACREIAAASQAIDDLLESLPHPCQQPETADRCAELDQLVHQLTDLLKRPDYIPLLDPPPAPDVSSPTHPNEYRWYPNDDVDLVWDQDRTVEWAFFDGYSYTVDESPATQPDDLVETTDRSLHLADLPDGHHFFHIRTRDRLGQWSETTHFGIRVDDTPPGRPLVNDSNHPDPDVPTNNRTADLSWHADDVSGVSNYSWTLDQSLATDPGHFGCSTAPTPRRACGDGPGERHVQQNLEHGDYWLHVLAQNGAGLYGEAAHRRIRVDLIPPSAPALGSDTHPDPERWYPEPRAHLTWPATDDDQVAGYAVVIDQSSTTDPGQQITTRSAEETRRLPDGVSYVHVRAFDRAGNAGPVSHLQIRTDATPPDVPQVSDPNHPDPDVPTSNTTADLAWASTDVSGVPYYSWTLDRSPATDPGPGGCATAPEPRVACGSGSGQSHTQPNLAHGDYWLHVVARNGADLFSPTRHRRFRVDSPPSAAEITSSSHPVSGEWYAQTSARFTASATDDDQVAGYAYLIDGNPDTDPGLVPNSPSGSIVEEVPQGVSYLHVRAIDSMGNGGAVVHREVRADTDAPSILEVSGTLFDRGDGHPIWPGERPEVTVDAIDASGVAAVELRIDGNLMDSYVQDCPDGCPALSTLRLEAGDVPDGYRNVLVRVEDRLGHVSERGWVVWIAAADEMPAPSTAASRSSAVERGATAPAAPDLAGETQGAEQEPPVPLTPADSTRMRGFVPEGGVYGGQADQIRCPDDDPYLVSTVADYDPLGGLDALAPATGLTPELALATFLATSATLPPVAPNAFALDGPQGAHNAIFSARDGDDRLAVAFIVRDGTSWQVAGMLACSSFLDNYLVRP
jgi:hypothetical protein